MVDIYEAWYEGEEPERLIAESPKDAAEMFATRDGRVNVCDLYGEAFTYNVVDRVARRVYD